MPDEFPGQPWPDSAEVDPRIAKIAAIAEAAHTRQASETTEDALELCDDALRAILQIAAGGPLQECEEQEPPEELLVEMVLDEPLIEDLPD